MKMKAIADKRKPKRKSDIPYRLKSSIENQSAGQRREKIASNESATEQTQQAAGEVVYRASQVPPQIRYAINKHKRKVSQEKQRTDEHIHTTQQDTPISEQGAPTQDAPTPQERAKNEAQKEAIQVDSHNPSSEGSVSSLLSPATEDKVAPTAQLDISQTLPHSPEQSLPPKAGITLELNQQFIVSWTEGAQGKVPSSSGSGSIGKGRAIAPSASIQKPQATPKTKQYTEKQAATKHIRSEKATSASTEQTSSRRITELGRLHFKKNVQKQTIIRAQKSAKTTGATLQKMGVAAGHATKAVIVWLVGLVGSVGLLVIFCLVLLVAAVAASPFGIFFSNEPSANAIPLSSAVAQINMELNTRLMELQDVEYETIEIHGAPPEWSEVIAVFAIHIAGADDGMDVALLDNVRVGLLQNIFWDMCTISSEVETEEPPTTDDTGPTEKPKKNLHITITAKAAEDMRTIYGFNNFQNEMLDMLLEEESSINALISSLSISQTDALDLLSNLPDDLPPERRAVVQQALMLVGKVNYFWGGKSLVIGWDSRWGQLRKVTSTGSPTTGTYRPYGLDCSGFADWVFYNASGGDYIIGHGGGAAAQHRYCTNISWSDAQPGDLVFYPGDSHVGIVGGWGEDGNILIIHCASGDNNVIISGKRGFSSVGQPVYYTSRTSDSYVG